MFKTYSIWKSALALLAAVGMRTYLSLPALRFARWVAQRARGAAGNARSSAPLGVPPGSVNLHRPATTPEAVAPEAAFRTSDAGVRAVPHAVASALAEAVDAAVGRRATTASHWQAVEPIKRAIHAARTLGIPVEALIIEVKEQLRVRHPEHGTARRVREPLVTLLIGAYYRA